MRKEGPREKEVAAAAASTPFFDFPFDSPRVASGPARSAPPGALCRSLLPTEASKLASEGIGNVRRGRKDAKGGLIGRRRSKARLLSFFVFFSSRRPTKNKAKATPRICPRRSDMQQLSRRPLVSTRHQEGIARDDRRCPGSEQARMPRRGSFSSSASSREKSKGTKKNSERKRPSLLKPAPLTYLEQRAQGGERAEGDVLSPSRTRKEQKKDPCEEELGASKGALPIRSTRERREREVLRMHRESEPREGKKICFSENLSSLRDPPSPFRRFPFPLRSDQFFLVSIFLLQSRVLFLSIKRRARSSPLLPSLLLCRLDFLCRDQPLEQRRRGPLPLLPPRPPASAPAARPARPAARSSARHAHKVVDVDVVEPPRLGVGKGRLRVHGALGRRRDARERQRARRPDSGPEWQATAHCGRASRWRRGRRGARQRRRGAAQKQRQIRVIRDASGAPERRARQPENTNEEEV